MQIHYAIVFVSNMKRSIAFYRDVIGLPLKFETPEWTELATEGATLALHASDGPNPDRENPQHTVAGRCRPGLSVQDLDGFHQRVVDAGAVCLQEPQELHGVKLAQYLDPDGLAISVSQATAPPA